MRISIHALLAESDIISQTNGCATIPFLSTLSLRRATVTSSTVIVILRNFYPRSPCGERLRQRLTELWKLRISIHALLAESDVVDTLILTGSMLFLSTLSLRRATIDKIPNQCQIDHFYPRSPCGERHKTRRQSQCQNRDFYPRSPCGERPVVPAELTTLVNISIHALLAESDHLLII